MANASIATVAVACAPYDPAEILPMNPGDTGYVILSGAMVMLMTPGLGLFYGGMVSQKNVLNTLMLSFVSMCIVAVMWVCWGYSFAFGAGNGFFGDLKFIGSVDIGLAPYRPYSTTVSHFAFWWFQLTFAMITPALVSGTVIGRVRMRTWILFNIVWSTVVYNSVAHWIWAAWIVNDSDGCPQTKLGWIRERGAIDFAGGTVVHIASGFSALAAALVIGRPARRYVQTPHNVPLVFVGTALLWFGWNGFNGGSALNASDGVAALATVNTNVAAAMGMLTWLALDAITHKATPLGAMTGAVVGLVCVTPAAGFIRPLSALVFGVVGSCSSFFAIKYLKRGIADTLDAFFCHGVAGTIGTVLVGFFSETKANPAAPNGVFFDASGTGGKLLGEQTLAAFVTAVWSFAFTFVFLTGCKFVPFVGLRPSEEHESIGLDESMHGQKAYELPSEEPAEELVAVVDVDSSVRKGTSSGNVQPPSPADAGVVFAVPIATPTEEVVSC